MQILLALTAIICARAQTTGATASTFSPFEVDCEEYLNPSDCNGKSHEGKLCYWHPGAEPKCQEAEVGDDEWHCLQQSTEATCMTPFCTWDSTNSVCYKCDGDYCGSYVYTTGAAGTVEYGEYEAPEAPEYETPENYGESVESIESPESIKTDCEIYVTSDTCAGQSHEGKTCYWDAMRSKCEEGEYGDQEHICAAAHLDQTACEALPGCYYYYDGKCSDEYPGLLRNTQPSSSLPVDYRLAILYFFLGLGGTLVGFYTTMWCMKKRDNTPSYVTMDAFANQA